jgi:uroporphyrinogen-III synthase
VRRGAERSERQTGPLSGKTILVTRPLEQAMVFAARLRELGANAIAAPTIELHGPEAGGPLDEAVREAAEGRFAWVVFTSAYGVRAWWLRLDALEADPPEARVAVVGDSTSAALWDRGVEADLVPESFTTEALGDVFPSGKGRVLLARADLATDALEEVLRSKGWEPERVDAYRVAPGTALPEAARRAIERHEVDAVTFTSPSTVEGYLSLAIAASRPPAVCIGPVTAAAAGRLGFEVAAVADPHTEDGMIDALISVFPPEPA